jgi:transcriptional regulator with XRE-family HTH domain
MTEKQRDNFRANLRVLMASDNTSQRALAMKFGVSATLICRVLSGERTPTLDLVMAVANRYKCKADDILNRKILKEK